MSRFENMSSPKQLGMICLIWFVLASLLALALEGALRVRKAINGGGFTRIESLYHIDQATQLRIPVAGYDVGRISINKSGFRNSDIPMKKPEGLIRLAFLGASTTFCAEVGNAETWPHLVVERLKQRYPDHRFDYINAAVPGYVAKSSLKALQLRVLPYQPDIIVIYHGTNDLSGISEDLARKAGLDVDRGDKTLSWPSDYSLAWYLIEKNLMVLWQRLKADAPENKLTAKDDELSTPFKLRMLALVNAAKQHTDKVLVLSFSSRLRPNQSHAQLKEAAITSLYYMPYMTPEGILKGFQAYNGVIRALASETNSLLVGDEYSIPADSAHFKDSVHFTVSGNIKQAQRVLPVISKAVQKLKAEMADDYYSHSTPSLTDLPLTE